MCLLTPNGCGVESVFILPPATPLFNPFVIAIQMVRLLVLLPVPSQQARLAPRRLLQQVGSSCMRAIESHCAAGHG
jgi:hypothetical protein